MIGQWKPRPDETPFWDWLSVWIYTKPKPIRDVLRKLMPSGPSSCSAPNLYLNGLTEISEGVATGLSLWTGAKLELNGVSELDARTAEALVLNANNRALYLEGVTSIDENTANALAQYQGRNLFLSSVTSLSVEQLDAFNAWSGNALVIGLESLSVDQANVVQRWDIQNVAFPNLKNISDDAVLALVDKRSGHYMIGDKDVITPPQANLFNHWILSLGPHRSVTLNVSLENALLSTTVCDESERYYVYCHDLSEPSAMMDLTFVLNVYDTL